MQAEQKKRMISWFLFVILCIIWGSSFKLMRDSTRGFTAGQIASVRIFSAGLVFLPFALAVYKKIPPGKIPLVILSAVLGNLLPAIFFAIALTLIDGSLGGILNSLTPLCVLLIGTLFFHTPVRKQKLIGVITGFAGFLILTLYPLISGEKEFRSSNLEYSLLIVLSTLLYGINVNMVARLLRDINSFYMAVVSLSFMLIPAGLLMWTQGIFWLNFSEPSVQSALHSTIILGVAGSALASVLFYMLVKRAGGLFAALVTYGIPFVAIFWGIIDGERITVVKLAGLAIILAGVYLANKQDRKPEADELPDSASSIKQT